jgi:hypothetical protein
MKHMLLLTFIAAGISFFIRPVAAQVSFDKVELRTNFAGTKEGKGGRIFVDGSQIRFAKNEKADYFSIPVKAITEIFYSRVSGRRIGAAIVVSPLLLFSKGKKHYMTLSFDDKDKMVGAIEFKLDKSNYRPLLRAVEQVTGLAMKYDQEGIKDTEEKPAERHKP